MSGLNSTVKEADLLNEMCWDWGQGAFEHSPPSGREANVLRRICSLLVLNAKPHSRLRDLVTVLL